MRGAKTIREMLAKHRENESCAGCHARIDPWGFSLEHFDAIGSWREAYVTTVPAANPNAAPAVVSRPIDACAELVDGHTFDGVLGLRDALLARSDRFTLALSAKLLVHAIGHPTPPRERQLLAGLVDRHRAGNGGFADLIVALCTSQPFLGN